MPTKKYSFQLDFVKELPVPLITGRVGEINSTELTVFFTNDEEVEPIGDRVPIFYAELAPGIFIRDDGSEEDNMAIIDNENAIIQYTVSRRLFARAGRLKNCYFALEKSNGENSNPFANLIEQVPTRSFTIKINKDVMEDNIELESFVPEINNIKNYLGTEFADAVDTAKEAKDTSEDAKIIVQNGVIVSQSNNGIMAKEDKIMLDDTQAKTNKIIDTTTSIQYIYVDASYSQTDSSDGSQDKPYKTIQAAVDSLAYLKSKDVYIYVRSGDYLETVMLKGNMVSSLWIQSDPANTTKPNLRSINIFDCFGYMRVSGFNFTALRASGDRASIRFSRCLYGGIRDCTFEATNTLPAIEFDGSTGSLASSSFKNQTIALNSINGSNVRVDDNTASTGNALFAYIQSANVYINGTGSFIKSFTKQFNLVQGGNLNLDIAEQDPVLANGWVPYNTTTYVPKIRKTTDGKIKFSGLIKDGTVGQGINAITLPAGLRPLKNVVYPAFSSDATIAKIIVDRTGNFVVEKSSGTYVALDTVEFQGDRETFIF